MGTVHNTQEIVKRMQESMIKTLDEKDGEIRALRQQLRNSRALAVKAEIAYLQKRRDDLTDELKAVTIDLRAKKAQFKELSAQGVGVLFGEEHGQDNDSVTGEGSGLSNGHSNNHNHSSHSRNHNLNNNNNNNNNDNEGELQDSVARAKNIDFPAEWLGNMGVGVDTAEDVMMSTTRAIHEDIDFNNEDSYHDDNHDEFDDALELHHDQHDLAVDSDEEESEHVAEVVRKMTGDSVGGDEGGDEGGESTTTTTTTTTTKTTRIRNFSVKEEPEIDLVGSKFDELKVTLEAQTDYDPNIIFAVGKSANKNCVVYTANMITDSMLNAEEPCIASWIMKMNPKVSSSIDGLKHIHLTNIYQITNLKQLPNGKHPTEDLNMIERNTAYGCTGALDPSIKSSDGSIVGPHFRVTVASLTDRSIDLYLMKSKKTGKVTPIAKTTISNNANVALKSVHVTMTDSWIPGVAYVDIYGIDISNGELVHERKKP